MSFTTTFTLIKGDNFSLLFIINKKKAKKIHLKYLTSNRNVDIYFSECEAFLDKSSSSSHV